MNLSVDLIYDNDVPSVKKMVPQVGATAQIKELLGVSSCISFKAYCHRWTQINTGWHNRSGCCTHLWQSVNSAFICVHLCNLWLILQLSTDLHEISLTCRSAIARINWYSPAKTSAGNPIFPGWYADPEGTIFNKAYWVYPTYSDKYEKQVFMDAFFS